MASTINVELYTDDRDFIVTHIKYALSDNLLNKIKRARPNKENVISVQLDDFDLEQLIGNLSLEANHNKKRSIQELACEIAEKLEYYEFQLKRIKT